jgi:energy-coupling factor transport system permease protein
LSANLRTVLVVVSAITTLSLVYNAPIPLLAMNALVLILLATAPGGARWKKLGHRLRGLGRLAIALFVAQALFRRDGVALWAWGWLRITDHGLESGIVSGLRLLLLLLSAGMLFDYPFTRWLQALRAWRLPYEFAFLVANVMHFTPLLEEQFRLSREALLLRGVDLQHLPIRQRFRAFSLLALPIVARTLWQVRYRAASLELRGFRLQPVRTDIHPERLTISDLVIQAEALVIALILLYVR